MAAFLFPQGKQQYEGYVGVPPVWGPLVGGKVYTYDTGTTNPRTTWQDAGQIATNANPVILDARGEAVIFWSGVYRVVLKDSLDNTIWSVDGVSGGVDQLRSDLANFVTPSLGAALVGYSPTITYPANTVGSYLNNFYARTPSEIAAGVTPTNYTFPEMNTRRYGSDPTGGSPSDGAINQAVLVANNYSGGGSSRILIPGGKCRIDSTIQMPTRENTEMVFEGNIDVSNMGAGSTLFDFFGSSVQTLRFHDVTDVGRRIDAVVIRHGTSNQIFFATIRKCRYGIKYVSAGNGAHSKVENQFYYSNIGECTKGIYFQAPSAGADACEGAQFWGGFVYANIEHGVLIDAGVNANFGFITGAIDGFTVGFDYVNNSALTGFTLMLKFMQNPAYYTLGATDALYNSQTSGVDLRGPGNGSFPAFNVSQENPVALPAGGNICAAFKSGNTVSVEQGIIVSNDYSFGSSTAVALHAGYVRGANAAAASSGYVRSIHRNTGDTFITLGAGMFLTRRAGANTSDVFFLDSANNTMGKFYAERDSVQIPVAKTPATAAAAGEAGQIAWDATFMYVCVAANTWKRVAIATW